MKQRRLTAKRTTSTVLAPLLLSVWLAGTATGQVPAVQVWDARGSDDVFALEGHTNGVVSAAFCQSDERIVTGSADKTVRIWDAKTGALVLLINQTGFNRAYAAVSADGTRILTTNIPYVRLWDGKTGDQLLDLTRHVGLESSWPFPFHAAISADGKQILAGSRDERVGGVSRFPLKLRDAKTGADLVTFKGNDYWTNCSAFSPDGSRLATGSETADDKARVWDCQTGAELRAFEGHGGSVWAVSFSPDGKRLATGGVNGKVSVWDLQTGAKLLTLTGHTRVVTSVAFSPDGHWILSGSQDHTARIWDTATGREQYLLKGHTESVTSVQFSRDGQRLVTASVDRTARLWDFQHHLDASATKAKE